MEMKTSPGQSGMRAGGGSGRMSRSKKPCDEFERKKFQRKKLQRKKQSSGMMSLQKLLLQRTKPLQNEKR